MDLIIDLIEGYDEMIDNSLMSGIKYNYDIDVEELKSLIKKSKYYHFNYGAELLEKILNISEKEKIGIDFENSKKIEAYLNLMIYMEKIKKELEIDKIKSSLSE